MHLKLLKDSTYIIRTFIVLVYIVFFIFLFILVVDNNKVFRVDTYLRHYTTTLFSESFGFFTKDPRMDNIKIFSYNKEEENWKQVDLRNNSKYSMYGLNRKSRVLNYEFGKVINSIDKENWKIVKSIEELMNVPNLSCQRIDDKKLKKIPKGMYIILVYDMIPWEFKNITNKFEGKYAVVEIY